MPFHIPRSKIVDDPIRGTVDITDFLPIIDTPEFQSLSHKFQLGITFLIFTSATHMRKAHSFGALGGATELTDYWLKLGMITAEEARAVRFYALTHDIGHYALCHVIEPLMPICHDDRGILIIEQYKEIAQKCGVNFELAFSLANHSNPLYLAVHDKNIGVEKLDYLRRDGAATVGEPPDVKYLGQHIFWNGERLLVHKKARDEAKEIQLFYVKLFKNVYLRKCAVINQRDIQKQVYLLLKDREITIDKLGRMRDFELFVHLTESNNPQVNRLANEVMGRNLFKEAVVVRYNEFIDVESIGEKEVKVFGVSGSMMNKIIHSQTISDKNPDGLLALEEKIARAVGLNQEDVLVVTVVSPERFQTKDIEILDANGNITPLSRKNKGHMANLGEIAREYAALRICAKEQYRRKLAQNAEKIKEIIFEEIEQD